MSSTITKLEEALTYLHAGGLDRRYDDIMSARDAAGADIATMAQGAHERDGMSGPKTWTFGRWTLAATRCEDGRVDIQAFAFTPRTGSQHGHYAFTPEHGVLTVSMASAKVNAHMRTAKVRRMLEVLAAL